MSHSFKVDPETLEATQKVKRHGNKRQNEAMQKVLERRKDRKQKKASLEKGNDIE